MIGSYTKPWCAPGWQHRFTVLIVVLIAGLQPALAQPSDPHRPPAIPLIANNPYFSVWSMADKLTDAPTRHWSEAPQPMLGLIRINGATYRWMGAMPRRMRNHIPVMKQESVELTPLHSRYRFTGAGVELNVDFFTAAFPDDLDVMSRPVTYLTWTARSMDGASHHVDLLLDVGPEIAVNQDGDTVTWGRSHVHGLTLLNIGSQEQAALHQSGDRIRIDWGYFHLAVPDAENGVVELAPDAASQFALEGKLSGQDDMDMPRAAVGSRGEAAHAAAELPMGDVGDTPVARHVVLAYTEQAAIEYLGRKLRPYWQHSGLTPGGMMARVEEDYPALVARSKTFDSELQEDMAKTGGADYEYLTSLVFRQTLAAHTLAADVDGTLMLFSKENDSNGCIDTVDVTYPSAPFFLLFNPRLLQAQLEPVMRYAALPRWTFPFAPHDLGTFPIANGQVYGGGEVNEQDQMPVEESGNLILLVAALEKAEGNWDFARQYLPQLTKWAEYLEKKGIDPDNQLSTDDFAGHLAHNANLSIKAIEALGAFAQIAKGLAVEDLAKHYEQVVRDMPLKWQQMAREDSHYKLAFDESGSWSQKYNLVWDRLLGLHVFPKPVMQAEWIFYQSKMQPYGLPLDNRKSITKLDWEVWTAAMAPNSSQSQDLLHRLVVWADTTPSRVPTTDYYDTVSGKQMGFQARSVVGGVFMKALFDPEIVQKWRAKAQAPQ